jgi:hypothetical protein
MEGGKFEDLTGPLVEKKRFDVLGAKANSSCWILLTSERM